MVFDLLIPEHVSRNSEFHAFRRLRELKCMGDTLGGSGAHFP